MPTLQPTNFTRDWRNELLARLRQLGIEVDPLDTRAIEYVYFSAVGRLIEQRPRTVHKAREFRIPREHRKSISKLRRKIEEGHDLRPHQNRSILSTASPDRLLNDWGIHHLHLGFGKPDADGLAPRTKDILFVMFDDHEAFLLAVRSHGRGHGELWAETEFLEIVRRNWPRYLNPLELRADPKGNPSPREILKARIAGLLVPVVLSDGVGYLPQKGGYSTNGIPWHASLTVDRWLTRIWNAENRLSDAFGELVAKTRAQELSLPDQVSVTMQLINDRVHARVDGTDVVWALES